MKGFTLLELIIYLGIVAGILVAMFNLSWQIVYGGLKSSAVLEVQQNSRFVMEKISQSILAASNINSPLIGEAGDSLSLEMQDSGLGSILFQLSEGKVFVSQGDGPSFALTSDRVRVADLQFTNLSFANTPGSVGIKITIEYNNPSNLNQYEASLSTQGTVSLRK